MGVTLTGKSIKDSYKSMLKLSDNNPITSFYKTVTDGYGNDSGLSISSTAIKADKIYSGMTTTEITAEGDDTVLVTKGWVNEKHAYSDFMFVNCSDENTSLSVKGYISMLVPRAIPFIDVIDFTLNTAPTGAGIIIDVQINGVTIYDTLPTIDIGDLSTQDAAVPQVLTGGNANVVAGDIVTILVTQVGSVVLGAGLKSWISYNNEI